MNSRMKRKPSKFADPLFQTQPMTCMCIYFICRCKELVKVYMEDLNPEARLPVGSDMRKIQLCFQLLKVSITHIPVCVYSLR